MDSHIQTAITICGYDFAGNLPALEEALLISGSTVLVGNMNSASLGDRVSSLIIAKIEYSNRLDKGKICSQINDAIRDKTNNDRLGQLFRDNGLVRCIRNNLHGNAVPKKVASAVMEALIAAAFLSGGLDAAETVMKNLGII